MTHINRYICLFGFMGAVLRIEMQTPGKKHDAIEAACKALADKLGATYLHSELLDD